MAGTKGYYCKLNPKFKKVKRVNEDKKMVSYNLALAPKKLLIFMKEDDRGNGRPNVIEVDEMRREYNRTYAMNSNTEKCIEQCFKNLGEELLYPNSEKAKIKETRHLLDIHLLKIMKAQKKKRMKETFVSTLQSDHTADQQQYQVNTGRNLLETEEAKIETKMSPAMLQGLHKAEAFEEKELTLAKKPKKQQVFKLLGLALAEESENGAEQNKIDFQKRVSTPTSALTEVLSEGPSQADLRLTKKLQALKGESRFTQATSQIIKQTQLRANFLPEQNSEEVKVVKELDKKKEIRVQREKLLKKKNKLEGEEEEESKSGELEVVKITSASDEKKPKKLEKDEKSPKIAVTRMLSDITSQPQFETDSESLKQ